VVVAQKTLVYRHPVVQPARAGIGFVGQPKVARRATGLRLLGQVGDQGRGHALAAHAGVDEQILQVAHRVGPDTAVEHRVGDADQLLAAAA